jgi:gluconate kinase
MFILLNGPLGIGKSTLAEALSESLDNCVMLDGDHVVAVNPPPPNEVEYLHTTLELLIRHHWKSGYRHFVINHIWRTSSEIAELRDRLIEIDSESSIRIFLLAMPLDENLRRIEYLQSVRALNEQEFEMRTAGRSNLTVVML